MTNRLREVRDSFGVSQAKLAEAAGLSLRQVQNIEAGAQPRVDTALRLARALHVPLTDLFEEAEQPA